VTRAEEQKLFTPLALQGEKAMEEQKKARDASAEDLLQGVISQLKKWVQECLVVEEKRKKLLEKGMLKCKVQARWSESLHEKLKDLIASYGGKLAAASDKDGAEKAPAWATAAELRSETWLVGFDVAAFQTFMHMHPETVDPPEEEVFAYVKEFVMVQDMAKTPIRALLDGLQKKFGRLRRPLLDRAKSMAGIVITQQHEEDENKAKKGPGGAAKGKAKAAATDRNGNVVAKKIKTAPKANIVANEDVAWAEATLVPLGLKADGVTPVVVSPTAVAAPILEGLKAMQGMHNFKELLRTTKIGKVVNCFRHHQSPEIAKASKELVSSWKAAIIANNKEAKDAASKKKP